MSMKTWLIPAPRSIATVLAGTWLGRPQYGVDFEGITLDLVVRQKTILADSPYRGSRHLEIHVIGLRAQETVVAPGDLPPGRNTAPVLVLKSLDALELEVVDMRLKSDDPALNAPRPTMSRLPLRDDEVLPHHLIDSFWILWLLPHLPPKLPYDCNAIDL